MSLSFKPRLESLDDRLVPAFSDLGTSAVTDHYHGASAETDEALPRFPHFGIDSIQGRTLTVSFASSADQTVFEVPNHPIGPTDKKTVTVSHPGGTAQQTITFTIPSNYEGSLPLIMKSSESGAEIQSFALAVEQNAPVGTMGPLPSFGSIAADTQRHPEVALTGTIAASVHNNKLEVLFRSPANSGYLVVSRTETGHPNASGVPAPADTSLSFPGGIANGKASLGLPTVDGTYWIRLQNRAYQQDIATPVKVVVSGGQATVHSSGMQEIIFDDDDDTTSLTPEEELVAIAQRKAAITEALRVETITVTPRVSASVSGKMLTVDFADFPAGPYAFEMMELQNGQPTGGAGLYEWVIVYPPAGGTGRVTKDLTSGMQSWYTDRQVQMLIYKRDTDVVMSDRTVATLKKDGTMINFPAAGLQTSMPSLATSTTRGPTAEQAAALEAEMTTLSKRETTLRTWILVHETAQDIADALLATGQDIDDLRTAVGEGKREEEWELNAWHAYVDKVRTYGPVSPLELQAAEAGEVAQRTEAALWSYVDSSLADAEMRISQSRDDVSLAGTVTGTDTIRPAISLALANLGGSASLSSLKGSLPFAKVSLVPGADVNRALGTIESTGAAPVSIAAASGIANGQTSNDFRKTFAVNGLGNVTVETDTGVRDYSYSQVQDIYKLKMASNTLASTQNFHYWMQNINYGYVKVQLESGKYISAIDVTRLTPSGTGNLVVSLADGTTESFPVSGSGSIRIDKTVTGFTLYSQTGSYGLGNIDTRAVTPATGWEDMTEVRKLTGAASMLDLTGAGKLVTQVTGKVDSQDPNDVITVHVYRGEQKVETKVIGPDGLLSIQNDGGFSSIVLTHSIEASPLFVGGLSIETDGTNARTDWAPLSNASNAQLSQLSAPRWVTDVSFNYIDTGRNNGVLYRYGGQDVQINGVHKEGATNTDPSKYHRIEARLMGSGSVSIRRLLYINAGGLFEVPSSFYTLLGSTVILHPGAPEFLAVEMQGTGRIEAPYYAKSGAAAEDVMPPSTPNFDADWLQWQAQPHETEGWTEVPSGVINRRVVAVAGSTLGTLWRIRNDGMQAGEVTVKVHVGQTGTTADPTQKIFTGVINPLQSRGLAFNVGILEGGDTVSLEIIRPDGTSFEYGRVTREARSNEIRQVNPVTGKLEWVASYSLPNRDDQIRIARTYLKVAAALGKDDMKTAAIRLLNAGASEEQRLAYIALTNLPVTSVEDEIEITRAMTEEALNEMIGIMQSAGGDASSAAQIAVLIGQQNYSRELTKFLNLSSGNQMLPWINKDSLMGRALSGLVSSLNPAKAADFKKNSDDFKLLTGIDLWSIAGLPADQIQAAVKARVSEKGFGYLFDGNQEVVTAKVGKPYEASKPESWYTEIDSHVFIRFDLPASFTSFSGKAKVLDLNGNSYSELQFYVSDSLILRIPMDQIRTLSQTGEVHKQFYLRLEVSHGNGSALPTSFFVDSQIFRVETGKKLKSLSTNPDISKQAAEDIILNEFATNFPLENPSGRYLLLGSGYHDGSEFFAADINSNSGGDTDRGDIIRAVSDGVMRIGKYTGDPQKDLNTGAITIDHITKAGAISVPWQSGYLHVPIFATGRRELVDVIVDGKIENQEREIFEIHHQETVNGAIVTMPDVIKVWDGKAVKAKDVIAYEGGRTLKRADGSYDEGIENSHIHVFAKKDGSSIDLRKALEKVGMKKYKAFDAGPDGDWGSTKAAYADNALRDVVWNDDAKIKSWVNYDERLLLDRKDQVPLTPKVQTVQHWLALEEGKMPKDMFKIVRTKIDAAGNMGWLRANADGTLYQENNMVFRWLPNQTPSWQKISI